jgi:capsular exopolysaccharide synthesis family protein
MAQSEAEIKETRSRLSREIRVVTEGIESAYLAADAKEKALRAELDQQKAMAYRLKDASVEYAILARDVDTNRQLYESVLQRMKQMRVETEGSVSNIYIIDKAVPPLRPSEPKKKRDVLLTALIASMFGIGLAFLLDYFDSTIKTPHEVERYLRLPNLATVPEFSSLDPGSYTRQLLPGAPPQSKPALNRNSIECQRQSVIITEAYRMLHTTILLARADEPARSILFTSSAPAEGKTITLLNTAIVFNQMGARVLVLDADLRHPNCHRVLGARNAVGLTEVLTGQKQLHEVIQPLATSAISLLSSGHSSPNPVALLRSTKMRATLAQLREDYDYVLIDSPPVMPVTDALLLSTMVDGVVLVINSKKTPSHIVKETHSRLTYARANILGVVLNQVDARPTEYAHYYYGDQHHSHNAIARDDV